ncbi:MAG: helicase-related protein [Acidithiobacillus sp.]
MLLETTKIPMGEFMGRFAAQFFEKAKDMLQPEYQPGKHPAIAGQLEHLPMLRQPFPAQAENILAASVHLYGCDQPAIVLSQDMGTGKTLVGSTIAMMEKRPQRIIVVVPPHLVAKWAREIEVTFPNVDVHKINHAGAIEVLEKAYRDHPGRPERPEFWIIGRVRLRMSYRFHAQTGTRLEYSTWAGRHVKRLACPTCGGILMKPGKKVNKKETESMDLTEKLVPGAADGSEGDEEGIYYEFADHDFLHAAKRTCQYVKTGDQVKDGCGAPLWSARRQHEKSTEETIASAMQKLPGIGKGTVEKIMALSPETIRDVVRDLSNGDIHPAMSNLLKKSAIKKVQAYIDHTGFTLGDGNYAPVEFIKRQFKKGWFDVAIFDELHELKGDNTAQGVAFGILASRCRKVIGLTGTLVDGYAASLHPLLFRCDPQSLMRMGYGADDGARFQREMGVVRDIVVEEEEDGLSTSRGRKVVRRQTRNLPGIHPNVVANLLLPNALFLDLPDIEKSLQQLAKEQGAGEVRLLPSYREVFVKVQQTEHQQEMVTAFCKTILDEMKAAMRLGGGKGLMGPVMSAALFAADGGFQEVVCHPRYRDKPLGVLKAIVQSEDELLEKERFMLDIALRSVSEGRKLLIYTIYTDKLDLTRRYQRILRDAGLDARVLKASVPTEIREQWVQDVLADGCEVLICNPNLVKTGLDLFEFTDILFMQAGYSTDTVLQASRRSWRIGQEHPVRVYYASYDQTPQMVAMSLMAKKIMVSNQAKGDISQTGLSNAIDDDEDETGSLMAIANQFLDGIRDHAHDAITGAISRLSEDDCTHEFTASSMSTLQALMHKPPVTTCTATADVVVEQRSSPTGRTLLDDFTEDLLAGLFKPQVLNPPESGARNIATRKPVRRKPALKPQAQSGFLDLFA